MKYKYRESYSTPYFSIEEGLDPNNLVAPYYRLTTGESVICCVMNADGEFIMVEDSPLAIKIDKIPVVYSLDTTGRRIFIKNIEFADYNGDGIINVLDIVSIVNAITGG